MKAPARETNIRVCNENREIVRRGYYEKDGRAVALLPYSRAPFPADSSTFESIRHTVTKAKPFLPDALEKIVNDDAEAFCVPSENDIVLMNCDSFSAAEAFPGSVVLNFANAHHVGGGYLNGANAQEESLCRCSTLYASLCSEAAAPVYRYNCAHKQPLAPKGMILSKRVSVFRDKDYALLDAPFMTAVITAAAPNLYGEAQGAKPEELRRFFLDNLRAVLSLAAHKGYRSVILGAWGCGAFGNDPALVAECCRTLLVGESKMLRFFRNVIFAIPGGENMEAFDTVFKEDWTRRMMDFSEIAAQIDEKREIAADEVAEVRAIMNEEEAGEPSGESTPPFYEMRFSQPVCNHTQGVDDDNIGWTAGVMAEGIPFEAEKWMANGCMALSVILPQPDFAQEDARSTHKTKARAVQGEPTSVTATDGSVLPIGMVDDGYETEFETIMRYVYFLEERGLVTFKGRNYDGAVRYLVDVEGHDLACVVITLQENGEVFATTPLHFRPFPLHKNGRPTIRVLPGGAEKSKPR